MLNIFCKLNFRNAVRQTKNQNGFDFSKIILVFLIFLSFLIVTGNVFGEVILDKQLIRPDNILKEEVEVTPCIPTYSLPLRIEDISNYQNFCNKLRLSPESFSLLQKNGFAVISTPSDIADTKLNIRFSSQESSPRDDFVAYYEVLKNKDLPIFITTDSMLHYYHIFFETILMKLEKDQFFSDIWNISLEMLDASLNEYDQGQGNIKEAAKRNVAYLSIALELLKPKEEQIVNDDILRDEYCQPGMDDESCDMMIERMQEYFGELDSYNYFSVEEGDDYRFYIPDEVSEIVEKEIELINKHKGWENSPLFIYREDYSQYIPRGHYTKSEKLKNYFQAFMWYGRITALIQGSSALSPGESICFGNIEGIISDYDARIQTLQALLLSNYFSQSEGIKNRWNRIYAITSFLVGFSDDLGPIEYSEILQELASKDFSSQELEENYPEFKDALMSFPNNPKIYGGLGECELLMPCPPLSEEEIQALKEQAKGLLSKTKGFRLMGQRFTLDSWLFSEMVSPYSGEYIGAKPPLPTNDKPFTFAWDDEYEEYRKSRPFSWVKTEVNSCPPPTEREVKGFPRGLDLMALLGSIRAGEILEELGDTQYSDYEKKFLELKKEVDDLTTYDWHKTLYMNWLYVLKSLWSEYTIGSVGYPLFMQTKFWQDKELNTALASWTQLRHDTILYVKQSYTMAEKGGMFQPPVVGYVEPMPEFYSRLLALTKMTNQGIGNLLSPEISEKLDVSAGLNRLAEILERLKAISIKELENQPLDEGEYNFIESFGSISENLIETISGGNADPSVYKTVLVADVHTDGNTKKVLEEGVGYLKTMIVAYQHPEGHILLGVGPVFSYYEFKQPMDDRLTDEAWREILDSNPPPEPEWTNTFSE
ncbi:MAG: DUF3160 domain-containing protein [Candidatus Atribacteria bacterium]|nr:DUF3160 domain-containing protein [Candidatus Atribacteria bacterium]